MAFVSRIGSILKQTVSKHTNLELSASNTSLYQAIRCMSSSKLFVGGISYATDEMSLREAFAQYGEVVEARIIMDRETGRSRGFGFVSYTSSEEASSAMQNLDGQDLHGRRIRVNYATDRPRGGGFGGYGGGGYGGGGGGYGGGGGGYGGGYGNANYGGGGSNYSGGDGGYSIGGGFGDGNYGSGGGSGSGSGSGSYGGGSSTFSTGNSGGFGPFGGVSDSENPRVAGGGENPSGFASTGYGGNTGAPYGGDEQQLGGNQDLIDGGNEGFGEDKLEGSYKDDDNEPDDYANTKR